MSDLISRAAAIEAMKCINDSICEQQAVDAILDLPTAERAGKLTRHLLKNANVPWGYDCSACGEWFVISEDTAERYNYCPNCGARLIGEEDA